MVRDCLQGAVSVTVGVGSSELGLRQQLLLQPVQAAAAINEGSGGRRAVITVVVVNCYVG